MTVHITDNESFFSIFPSVESQTSLDNLTCFLHDNLRDGTLSDQAREEAAKICDKIPISEVIQDWAATIGKPSTRGRYQRALVSFLKSKELFDEDLHKIPLSMIRRSNTEGIYNIINSLDIAESSRTITSGAWTSFCDFCRQKTLGIINSELEPRMKKRYLEALKISKKINWKTLVEELDPPFNLIARMTIWTTICTTMLLRISSPRADSALRIAVDQVDFPNRRIKFMKEQIYWPLDEWCYFDQAFMDDLKRHLNGRRGGYVFQSADGKHLYPKQVSRALKRASERLGYDNAPTVSHLVWCGLYLRRLVEDEFSKGKTSINLRKFA